MNKRKLRFNFIDIAIILVVIAALFVLVKVFLPGTADSAQAEANVTKIQYVIELQDIEDRFGDTIKEGQVAKDAIERKNIGVVVGVQSVPYEVITFDYTTGKETVAVVSGKITISVTIEADAIETDRAFTVDGCEIRVGQQYSVEFPGMYGPGYCVKIDEVERN